ncbi:hypothetical protein DAEQUDRAFT_197091 [Daedalea quercina L-15889]|uniref:P-loop containing nucleoside triphosphate hydrolase protein n=1 Tax=Daedalea quercina L-15889 TaxID=1314783 RepID=A0A165U829_9APHY|nr:hypothetical protein DAEQUDRAFT_197091 [Daedalea quercina L-15889]
MPRIRKRTSRRGTTNQREKIKHKVADTRKKRKKESKKNLQWKTRHPKDPGIPNNFPYKDQILAEVAEERRKVAEEKERRKEEKKLARTHAAEQGDVDVESSTDSQEGGPRSISAVREQADTAEDDIPVLANRDLPDLRSVLKEADVVIQVLDARDPLRCRSTSLEESVKDKKALYVLNKVDACPREAVQEWATTLRAEHPAVIFRSASAFLPTISETAGKGKGKERADDAWGVDGVTQCLSKWAQEKEGDDALVVAVVGVTNVGKSSFINSLLRKATLPTFKLTSAPLDGPTTTTYPQEISMDIEGKSIRVIDTPGLAWQAPSGVSAEDLERVRARDILQRNRGRIERLKDPAPVVAELVARADREDLMLFYNLPAFAAGDANAFLSGVARANGLIKKGGTPDLAAASRIVLRDWSTGKFPRYTRPQSASPAAVPSSDFADICAKNDEILSRLQTRKEMRKSSGVVKMSAGEAESREVAFNVPYFGAEEDEDKDDGTDEEVDELERSGDDVTGDEDEDEDASEDDEEENEDKEDGDEVPVPAAGKRKRAAQKVPLRPAKKVAFAAEPRGTKQARSAAGAAGSKLSVTKAKGRQDSGAQTKAKPTPQVKAAKVPKKTPSVASAMKKIANSSKKAKQPSSALKEGEETLQYDFSKFF